MTTPERIRRRQRIEIGSIIILVIATFWVGYQNDKNDKQNDACLISVVQDLTDVLVISRVLTTEDISNLNESNNIQDRLINNVLTAKTQKDIRNSYEAYQRDKINLQKEISQTQITREKNPIPAYPTGKCQ